MKGFLFVVVIVLFLVYLLTLVTHTRVYERVIDFMSPGDVCAANENVSSVILWDYYPHCVILRENLSIFNFSEGET